MNPKEIRLTPPEDLKDQPQSAEEFKPDRENDVDDVMHKQPVEDVNPETEIDADDAVHRKPSLPVPDPASEKDPDDLVHGN